MSKTVRKDKENKSTAMINYLPRVNTAGFHRHNIVLRCTEDMNDKVKKITSIH